MTTKPVSGQSVHSGPTVQDAAFLGAIRAYRKVDRAAQAWSLHLGSIRLPTSLVLAVQLAQLVLLPIASESSALDDALRAHEPSAGAARWGAIALAAAPALLAFVWPAYCLYLRTTPRLLLKGPPSPRLRLCGLILLGVGTVLSVSTVLTLRSCITARQLCKRGPFRFSRNPINVSIVLLAYALASLVPTLPNTVGTAWLALHLDAASRGAEEASLQQRFGGEWQEYAARVGRWWTVL